MSILNILKDICLQLPGYSFQFEEEKMMNTVADNQPFPCVFFEEYREGNFTVKYYIEESVRVKLYFCKLCPADNTAVERERIREEIKDEAVKPFIRLFNESYEVKNKTGVWQFFTPPPRFDVNEVSVMLQFDAVLTTC